MDEIETVEDDSDTMLLFAVPEVDSDSDLRKFALEEAIVLMANRDAYEATVPVVVEFAEAFYKFLKGE